jgi:hypothetical protein
METLSELVMICLLTFLLVKMIRSTERMAYADPLLDKLKHDLMRLHPKAKELRYFASDKSFTEDKKDMFICLKDENNQYYDANMLMYVMIHELAHAISHSYDDAHTGREFNENFDLLLKEASQIGIYDPTIPLLQNYCGVSADD